MWIALINSLLALTFGNSIFISMSKTSGFGGIYEQTADGDDIDKYMLIRLRGKCATAPKVSVLHFMTLKIHLYIKYITIFTHITITYLLHIMKINLPVSVSHFVDQLF